MPSIRKDFYVGYTMQFWEEDSIIILLFLPVVISKLLSIWDSVGVRSKSRSTWDKSQSLGLPRIFMKTKDWLIWKGFLRLKGWRSSFLWFEDIKTKLICNVFHQIYEAQDWRFKICAFICWEPHHSDPVLGYLHQNWQNTEIYVWMRPSASLENQR